MNFSATKFSRTRLLALLLVAVSAATAIGTTAVASATDGSIAKKCKKGYKKVGHRCKKKKKAVTPGTADPQTSVATGTLASVTHPSATKVIVKGSITFSKKPTIGYVTAIVNIQLTGLTEARGATINIKVDGGSLTQSFTAESQVPAFTGAATAKTTINTTIDSNSVAVS